MTVPEATVWGLVVLFVAQLLGCVLTSALLLLRVSKLERKAAALEAKDEAQDKFFYKWRHDEFNPVQNLQQRHDEYLQRVKRKINGDD